MSEAPPTHTSRPEQSIDRSGVRRIIQVVTGLLILAVVLFLSAGRLDWPMAWVYMVGWCLALLVMAVVLHGKHPGLINERGRRSPNTKRWDKILMGIYAPMPFLILAVAGVDAGRFGWSSMPHILRIAGGATLLLAVIMVTWAVSANRFFSAVVRIQDDRGHQVVTAGPYEYVRHPGYVGITLTWAGTPLLLGSWWALIPAGLTVALFVVRTALEDRTLLDELPGYAEYAQRVRHRLLPGIW